MENYESENEITELDLIYDAHDRLDALINLLEKKGILLEGEYERELDKIYEEGSRD